MYNLDAVGDEDELIRSKVNDMIVPHMVKNHSQMHLSGEGILVGCLVLNTI